MANEKSTLGNLIRLVRQQNNWTLRQMSAKVGIPLSTLAKVEADKLSLTYDKLQQFTSRLGMTLTEFLGQAESRPAEAVQISTPTYDYEYLCADLREKRMVPIICRIRAKSIAEFDEPVRHAGEEFIYVLEGKVEVHLQFYTSVILNVGQGIYLDSSMGHAYVAKDCDTALVLAVCSSEDVNLATELMSLAEGESVEA
jgi:transcriptional regulator with XRE-family HTH domain